MSRESKFFIVLKIFTGCISVINLGIATAFLLQKSISFFELSVVYSLILGMSLIFEYPSGNWADRYGRKKIYACGLLVTALQYGFYASFSNVYLIFAAAAFGGLGDALISGSFEAWITQKEKLAGNAHILPRTFGLSRSLTSVCSIAASLAVGLMLKSDLSLFYWFGAAAFITAGVFSIVFFSDNRGSQASALHYTMGSLKTFVGNRNYLFLALILAAAFSLYSIFILYWQPQVLKFGVSEHSLPFLYAFYLTGAATTGYIYSKWSKRLSIWIFLLTSFSLLSVSFIVLYIAANLLVFALGLFLYGIGFGSIVPIFFSWAAEIVPDDQCASILSLMSGISSLASVITTVAMGVVIQHYEVYTGAIVGLLLGIVSVLMVAYMKWNTAHLNAETVSENSNI